MIMFYCDYNEGAHPSIIKLMNDTNMEQHEGYSEDAYTEQARQLIRKACDNNDVDVHILVGTQANMTVISAALRTHQGVLSAETGHINCHETGAIEAGGHKVLALPTADGKITADQVGNTASTTETTVRLSTSCSRKWSMSNPTELGTIYTRRELTEIRAACDEFGLFLFSTEHGSVTAWRRPETISICRSSPKCAMCFTSGLRSRGHCLGKLL